MEEFFGILIVRTIIRAIGQYARYFFFLLAGKKRTLKSLSNESKNEYKDLGNAMTQDFLNAIVGGVIFGMVVLIIVSIVFG